MNVEWNDNAEKVVAQLVDNIREVLKDVSDTYSGKPVEEVRTALSERWSAVNEGASITEPELTIVATTISQGKRAWLSPEGRLMIDD